MLLKTESIMGFAITATASFFNMVVVLEKYRSGGGSTGAVVVEWNGGARME